MRKAAAFVLGFSLLTASVIAQDHGNPGGASLHDNGPIRVTVSFNGGSLAEYVAALRDSAGASANGGESSVNVIFQNEAASIPVGKVLLTRVTVESAIRAVCPQRISMPDGRVLATNVQDVGGEVLVIDCQVIGNTQARLIEHEQEQAREESEVEILPIASLIRGVSGVTVESVIASISEAAKLENIDSPTTIKYHSDTALLFVLGTERQLQLARQTIGLLEDSQRRASATNSEQSRRLSQLRMQMIDLEVQVSRSEVQVSIARDEREFARRMAEEGNVSAGEVATLEGKVRIAETELQGLLRQMDEVARQIREAEEPIAGKSKIRYRVRDASGAIGPTLPDVAAIIADGSKSAVGRDGGFVIEAGADGHQRLAQALSAMTRAIKNDSNLTMPEGWMEPVQDQSGR